LSLLLLEKFNEILFWIMIVVIQMDHLSAPPLACLVMIGSLYACLVLHDLGRLWLKLRRHPEVLP
jgi:hypothetical protein